VEEEQEEEEDMGDYQDRCGGQGSTVAVHRQYCGSTHDRGHGILQQRCGGLDLFIPLVATAA
jgi:hypothetical protein